MLSAAPRGGPLSPSEIIVTTCRPPGVCITVLFVCRRPIVPSCPPLPPVACVSVRNNNHAQVRHPRCLPPPPAASRCLPLPPVVTRCPWLLSRDIPFSPAASHCRSLPPAVSCCLPRSPVGPRCRTLPHLASPCLLPCPSGPPLTVDSGHLLAKWWLSLAASPPPLHTTCVAQPTKHATKQACNRAGRQSERLPDNQVGREACKQPSRPPTTQASRQAGQQASLPTTQR